MDKIKQSILKTFLFEEETILHVEIYLKSLNLTIDRQRLKDYLSEYLSVGLLKIYDNPSGGETKFADASDEFIEDYWFILTDKGHCFLNMISDQEDINSLKAPYP